MIQVLCQIAGNEGLTSITVTPDATTLIVGDSDGAVRV